MTATQRADSCMEFDQIAQALEATASVVSSLCRADAWGAVGLACGFTVVALLVGLKFVRPAVRRRSSCGTPKTVTAPLEALSPREEEAETPGKSGRRVSFACPSSASKRKRRRSRSLESAGRPDLVINIERDPEASPTWHPRISPSPASTMRTPVPGAPDLKTLLSFSSSELDEASPRASLE
mmetsp:Transcript_7967/g.23761  ORF Transcript_7967/g.23761 Transcript_7967/m.23761 type:complete len:182 (-) Transcript_7967:117-662(-)